MNGRRKTWAVSSGSINHTRHACYAHCALPTPHADHPFCVLGDIKAQASWRRADFTACGLGVAVPTTMPSGGGGVALFSVCHGEAMHHGRRISEYLYAALAVHMELLQRWQYRKEHKGRKHRIRGVKKGGRRKDDIGLLISCAEGQTNGGGKKEGLQWHKQRVAHFKTQHNSCTHLTSRTYIKPINVAATLRTCAGHQTTVQRPPFAQRNAAKQNQRLMCPACLSAVALAAGRNSRCWQTGRTSAAAPRDASRARGMVA